MTVVARLPVRRPRDRRASGRSSWLAKSAVTPTQDTISQPLALWPNGIDWANLSQAWNDVQIDQYFWNTIVLAAGSWLFALFIATTGGYALSVLQPPYAPVLNAPCSRRCSSPRSCCSFRSTSRS